MMFQSSCGLVLWSLALLLLCQQEVHGYAHLPCPPKADVDDPCNDGQGTCQEGASPNARLRCVPPPCGPLPDVIDGYYEEYDCWHAYTCAYLYCDDGLWVESGDTWLQCWFGGWSNGWDISTGGANCSTWW